MPMIDGGVREDLLPRVRITGVVECPRIGNLFDDRNTVITIGIDSVPIVFSQESAICAQCRNQSACRGYAEKRMENLIDEVICPQAGTTLELSVAQETWAGLENPECLACSHKRRCLPMAI